MSSASPMVVRAGGVLWIGAQASDSIGPRSSWGSPTTFMMRPRVEAPTGTVMGAPVSITAAPRAKPSVGPMQMVRTVLSPRCWATSSTISVVSLENTSILAASSAETTLLLSTVASSASSSALMASCWAMAWERPSVSAESSSDSSWATCQSSRQPVSRTAARVASRILRTSLFFTHCSWRSLRKSISLVTSATIWGRRLAWRTASFSAL
mmetsp:Transcript_25620/g.96468  ORF Transcript_25620/g.96468 Transcript_25620/m.96468 type:complete len:210 (-) Transcript_25620:275-904(-)